MPVQFFFIVKGVKPLDRKKLKSFIDFIFINERRELLSLTYVFCSDDYLLKINRDFLGHDFYTDIITFDMSSQKHKIEGEIYISIERVKENALKFRSSIQIELRRVIFHGALHLCGYEDKRDSDIKRMRDREDFYLNLYLK